MSHDVFWDLETITPEKRFKEAMGFIKTGGRQSGMRLVHELVRTNPDFQRAWFFLAHTYFLEKDYREALPHFQKGFVLGKGTAIDYARAAFAASQQGNNREAYTLLRNAAKDLPREKITGVMWYNLACYATRLKQFDKAMAFLKMALRRGYSKLKQYRDDPDLMPLRKRSDFKSLLAQVAR